MTLVYSHSLSRVVVPATLHSSLAGTTTLDREWVIDYRKAFDSVDRILLWQKLVRTSIDGNMLIVIQNMYKNTTFCVRDGSNCSDFFHQILVY